MKTKVETGKVYLNSVEQWLDTLPAAESEEFTEFCDVTPSMTVSYTHLTLPTTD